MDRIEIVGNIPDDIPSLRPLVERYEGQDIALVDMISIRDDLTRALIDAGYVNSGATLEPQDLSSGVLTYEVVIGRLTEVNFKSGTELHGLREDYVSKRLNPAPEVPLRGPELQERFQLLVADPNVKRIEAALVPGLNPGEATLDLKVVAANRFTVQAITASDRSPSVGGTRAGLAVGARNLLGVGDSYAVQANRSEGLFDATASLSVPFNRSGLSVYGRASYSEADVIEEPLNELDIIGEAYALAAGVDVPLLRKPGRLAFLSGEFVYKRNESELLGQRFGFSPGAVDGIVALSMLRLGQSYTFQNDSKVVAFRSTFSFGLDALQPGNNDPAANLLGSSNPAQPPKNFVSWLGQAQYAQRLGELYQVSLRVDGQYTDDTLASTERFAFGGPGSVRGYRTNEVIADRGVSATIALDREISPPPLVDGWVDSMQIGVFLDGGVANNALLADPVLNEIASVGVSARFAVSDRLSGEVFYAVPLTDTPDRVDDSIQDTGFGFRLVSDFGG